MAAVMMKTAMFTARPTAAVRRSAPCAPAGLRGVQLPARRTTAVRVASSGCRRLSVNAVSTPIRPEPLERVRGLRPHPNIPLPDTLRAVHPLCALSVSLPGPVLVEHTSFASVPLTLAG